MKNWITLIILLIFCSQTFAQNEKNPLSDFIVGFSKSHQSSEVLPRGHEMSPLNVIQHGLTPVMMCTNNGKCSGYSPAQVRAQSITPIVLCQAKTYCQGDVTVQQMESAGLVPSIVCNQQGECGGLNYKDIRKQGYTPIIICQSLNDCRKITFNNKILYVKPCTGLSSCGY